ncbi:gamma-interferon-inducible lysosomal thiol reductase-like [Tachypleus tridentatus]|uniref:gamma-interferon-inducible lysosomal thiol reductase-like n=1 Tax=Tachypleus tridentatus TaxID=6853 RepID=UPI003FD1D5C7
MTGLLTLFSLFLIATLVAQCLSAQPHEPVKVSVFYEALCPDSIDFIVEQLWPTYKKLSQIIQIDLVPHGKARTRQLNEGGWAFSCQHGVNECYGNLVQTCAIELLNNTDLSFPFVYCAMSSPHPHTVGPECADKLKLEYDPISKCVNSEQGKKWQRQMAQKTEEQNLLYDFVPRIVINQEYSAQNQNKALYDFKGLVCKAYRGPKPEVCRETEDDDL